MLSKLVDQLLADEGLREEFATSPAAVLERLDVTAAELELLAHHDMAELANHVAPELYEKLLDLSAIGMQDASHPGSAGLRIDAVEPAVVRCDEAVDLSVRLSLGPGIESAHASPRAIALRLQDEGASATAVAAPAVVDIARRHLVVEFAGVRLRRAGRYVVHLAFDTPDGPEAIWSRRLRVEERP